MPDLPLYDAIGHGYDDTRRADPALAAGLAARLGLPAGAAVLDWACGSGNYAVALAAHGLAVTGLDVSARMLDAARAKAPHVAWVQAPAGAMPFADGALAGAVCTLAIHHFADRPGAMRELARVLAPGAPFVLFTSDPAQMAGYWLHRYFPRAMAAAGAQMPPVADVAAALAAAGFRDVGAEPWVMPRDHQDLFLYAGKERPALYLDPRVRAGISTFADLADPAEVEAGCARLAADLAAGTFDPGPAAPGGDYMWVTARRA